MTWDTLVPMSVSCVERTFWWDVARPAHAVIDPLRAVIFDLDGALADVERDAHRVAFNAAFAEHGERIAAVITDWRASECEAHWRCPVAMVAFCA